MDGLLAFSAVHLMIVFIYFAIKQDALWALKPAWFFALFGTAALWFCVAYSDYWFYVLGFSVVITWLFYQIFYKLHWAASQRTEEFYRA